LALKEIGKFKFIQYLAFWCHSYQKFDYCTVDLHFFLLKGVDYR